MKLSAYTTKFADFVTNILHSPQDLAFVKLPVRIIYVPLPKT